MSKEEYIEKEAAMDAVFRKDPNDGRLILRCYDKIKDRLDAISPADVKPVVRGDWIYKERHEHYPSGKSYTARYCGVCGKRDHNEDGDFCGYCGADMRKEDSNNE